MNKRRNILKISAVYITKNESQNIVKSIDSCKAIADEIIVIDTGSTDDTIDLCKKEQCTTYNYVWENDFSSARNYAVSLCKNEIILFLDADEYFSPALVLEDKKKIIDCIVNEKMDGLAFPSTDIDKETNKVFYTSYATKLFLNLPEIKYKNTIHEILFNQNRDLRIAVYKDYNIIHTGYSEKLQKSKVERNIEILDKIKNKSTLDLFYLCRENLSLCNYEKADSYCDLFFKKKDCEECIKKTNIAYLLFFYKREIMENLSSKYAKKDIYNLMKSTEKAIPYIPEVYYDLGVWYFDKNLKKSREYFKKCILTNEDFKKDRVELNNYPYYESKIYYYLSKIDLLEGKKQDSIKRAIVSCMLDTDDTESLGLLLHLLQRGRTKDNLDVLGKIYKPKTKQQYEKIVIALSNTNLIEEFIYYALKYNTDFHGSNDCVFYAMILSGQTVPALETLSQFNNEKSNFIMATGILFNGTTEIYNNYFKRLSDKYKKIINWVLGLSHDSEKIDMKTTCYIISRLILMGVIPSQETFKKIIKYGNEKNIQVIIDAYQSAENYNKSIEIIENFLEIKSSPLKILLKDYLFSLFCTDQHNKLMEVYCEYFGEEMRKDNFYLYLLRGTKKLSKHNSQLKQKYTELFNNAYV